MADYIDAKQDESSNTVSRKKKIYRKKNVKKKSNPVVDGNNKNGYEDTININQLCKQEYVNDDNELLKSDNIDSEDTLDRMSEFFLQGGDVQTEIIEDDYSEQGR